MVKIRQNMMRQYQSNIMQSTMEVCSLTHMRILTYRTGAALVFGSKVETVLTPPPPPRAHTSSTLPWLPDLHNLTARLPDGGRAISRRWRLNYRLDWIHVEQPRVARLPCWLLKLNIILLVWFSCRFFPPPVPRTFSSKTKHN